MQRQCDRLSEVSDTSAIKSELFLYCLIFKTKKNKMKAETCFRLERQNKFGNNNI
jgi:hypothetical protein